MRYYDHTDFESQMISRNTNIINNTNKPTARATNPTYISPPCTLTSVKFELTK